MKEKKRADSLVRFGVAMEASLLEQFDAIVAVRGNTRSEAFRDLARAEITRTEIAGGGDAIGTLSLVYNHHVRELTEKLIEMQHALGDAVHSTLHIHLDHDHCLEVIVLHGPGTMLQKVADKMIATRGVKHGSLSLVSGAFPHRHSHLHEEDHHHQGTPSSLHGTKNKTAKKKGR